MSSIQKLIPLFFVGVSFCLINVFALSSSSKNSNIPPDIIIQPPTPGSSIPSSPSIGSANTCPVPSEAALRCIRQWACQYIIRLDLRCLLNLNGNPLLGNLLGGTIGSTAGGGGTGSGGLLGGILGI